MSWNNQKILISGGLGFIGSNLAIRLVELGAKVTIVDSLAPNFGGNKFNISSIKEDVQTYIFDIRESDRLEKLIKNQAYIFNLAGQTSHMDSMTDPLTDLDINCKAQLTLLESCKHHNRETRIVYSGTRQIYGRPQYLPVDEKHPINPVDINGINKIAGESYHLLYNQVYGIRSSVLRLTNTFGPGMRIKDAKQTFLGIWIKNLIQGAPFEVWGGDQLRDYNYVSDVVDAMLLTAKSDEAIGNIYNLGNEQILSLKETGDMMVGINNSGTYNTKTFPEERKKIDIGDYYSDITKIKSELGWEPKISMEESFKLTLAFYHQHIENFL